MGYGSIYGNRTISHLTEKEVRYLDRLFVKALRNTGFGRKEKERIEARQKAGEDLVFTLVDGDVDRMNGAETLYQQTGLYFFGDNEFAFRRFSDAKEYDMRLATVQTLPLLIASPKILDRLPESIDEALVEIERRCSPSKVKPGAVYENPEFRNGAWQLYAQVRELVPEILPTIRDRRTIERRFERQRQEPPLALETVLSYT